MSLNLRVIELRELDEILDFERKKLRDLVSSEMDRNFEEWNSKWRKESLEHYISLGWSFLAREPETDELVGYFIAQPLLFWENQTQSLWVEHLQFSTLQARDELCDLAYRMSREKHFQRVYFPRTPHLNPALSALKVQDWTAPVGFVKTTKA